MNSPLIDISAVIAIESLFRDGCSDPWAARLAGELADLFIYGDFVRYPVPVPSYSTGFVEEPDLIKTLTRLDPIILSLPYSTDERRYVRDENFSRLLEQFRAWTKNNRRVFQRWLQFTRTILRFQHHRSVFSFESRQSATVAALAREISVDEMEVIYTLDLIARYPLYGTVAGDQFYLNHPIRDIVKVPTMTTDLVPAVRPALAFRDTIARMAPKLTLDSYSALLHRLRNEVRERELHILPPGQLSTDVVRDIARKAGLPPKLKHVGRAVGIASGIVGGLGAIAILGPPAALVGATLSVSSAFWHGDLPAGVGQIKWLHWAMEWDLESQSTTSD